MSRYVSAGQVLLDRCPKCRAVDYEPLAELRARCRCGTVYRRSWRAVADVVGDQVAERPS